MATLTKKKVTSRSQLKERKKTKASSKNGHRKIQMVKQGGVYMLQPRRTPQALRRAKRLAALVRQDLAVLEHETTLDEVMRQLRGRSWSP